MSQGVNTFEDPLKSILKPKKEERSKIEFEAAVTTTSNLMPLLSTIGFDGIAGFLIGFAIEKNNENTSCDTGVLFCRLMYLESQE